MLDFFQFKITASDPGPPVRTAEARIQINVHRNQYPPRFRGLPYRQTVSENKRPGLGVFTVFPEDPDLQGEILLAVKGVPPAPSFFRLQNKTGFIFVKDNLTKDKALVMTVSTLCLITNYLVLFHLLMDS